MQPTTLEQPRSHRALPLNVMQVDVWSDVVCPWCYVGLANLDAALADFAHGDDVEVVVHSFQLDPAATTQSPEDHLAAVARKYGTSVGAVRARQAHLVSLGAERGIDFRFDRAWSGNTFDAHRLLHLALARGLQRPLKERLGRAYFTDGEPIGEHATLRRAAVDVGLDPAEVDEVLAGDAYAEDVRADIAAAHQMDVTGVPFFVVDGRLGLSGAQPPEVLGKVLERAWAERTPQVVTVAGADDASACGPDGCEI
jgi:predicted DsbA family dithiol-disulfide isomerase